MTDYTKYLPYYLRAVRHNVRAPGWKPGESSARTAAKFLDVSKEPSLKRPLVDHKKAAAVHVDMARAFNLRRGDLVQVLYGRDAGNTGVVRRVMASTNQVVVTGCNVIKSYRPTDAERQVNPVLPAMVAVEAPIHVTNVAPVDPVTKRPTRIKRRYTMSGECVRISKVSGCAMPDPVSPSPSLADFAVREKTNLKAGFLRGAPIASRTLDSWSAHQHHFRYLDKLVNRR